MKYVLRRTTGRTAFVAPSGSRKSYTPDIRKARRFDTEQDARADACGNEAVQPVEG